MLPSIFGENLFDDFFADPFSIMPAFPSHDALYGKHGKNLMKTDVRELDNGMSWTWICPVSRRMRSRSR